MSTAIKFRGGTTAQHSTFTGAARELTVDTTKNAVVVHNGVTAGGTPMAKESALASYLPLAGGTITGPLNEALGANIASASTINLTTATGNYAHVTGTTTINAITLAQGARRVVVFDGALQLTNGASLLLPGAANITTAAGDSAEFWGEAAGVVRCVSYARKTGSALASTAIGLQSVAASVAANALTLTYNGGTLDFRSATLTTGSPISNVTVSSNSVVVPSGATLGTTNAVAARLVLLEAYNAGSPVACVVNLAGGVQLDETNLISPTTISASALSAGVIYSASAVGANSPYRVVGFVDITEAAAGTWATAPTQVQGAGGQALMAMPSLGYGQTWQSVTRTTGVTYYNTTGKPIIHNRLLPGAVAGVTTVSAVTLNGGATFTFTTAYSSTGNQTATGSVVIPAGASYLFTDTSGTTATSTELR